MDLRFASPAATLIGDDDADVTVAATLIGDDDADVTVWLVSTEDLDTHTRSSCDAVLSDSERQYLSRIRNPEARLGRLAGRALLRRTLSHLTGVPPQAWCFEVTEHGQPMIARPAAGRDLRFSLAHTDGLVALAVAEGRAVGVDTETEGRALEALQVARSSFAPSETLHLEHLASEARHDRFLDLWTLKEAYAKARGLGVHLPFDSFSFKLDDARRTIGFTPPPDEGRSWAFLLARAGQRYRVAVVAEATSVTIRTRWAALNGPV